jgi:RNA polymerase subunit RPABC4/transcription elongation factor Spt4
VRAGGWRTGQAERRHRGGHAQAEPGGPAGLVPCAISVREEERSDRTAEPESLWKPSFPSPELVQHAADLIPHIKPEAGDLCEGPRWEIVVSPGAFKVRTRNYARAEQTYERAVERHRKQIDVAAAWEGEIPDPPPTRGTITGWTRRSRARLVERLSDLDYTKLYGRFHICTSCREEFNGDLARCPRCRSDRFKVEDRTGRLPAMLTLTYPGDWLTVAPSADVAMGHFQALCKRYARAWGEPLRGPWKKEFQGRGAVHFHISTTPPMRTTTVADPITGQPVRVDFKRWLSIVWAEIVAHPNPEERRKHLLAGTGVDYAQGMKMTDPRRMALYFAKYGAAATGKDYQHRVPPDWLDTALLCTSCAEEYEEDLNECPACGHPQADALERGSVGRFWGYRGLNCNLAIRHVTPVVGLTAGRIARRWYRAKGLTKTVMARRINRSTGKVRYRRTRARRRLFAHGRGFICVNDASAFASQLASALAQPQ